MHYPYHKPIHPADGIKSPSAGFAIEIIYKPNAVHADTQNRFEKSVSVAGVLFFFIYGIQRFHIRIKLPQTALLIAVVGVRNIFGGKPRFKLLPLDRVKAFAAFVFGKQKEQHEEILELLL